MLGLLKTKNPYTDGAHAVYAAALAHTRNEAFYTEYDVPDTFDGRFDLLLLHVFLVLERMLEDDEKQAEGFNQALFDATFADMDQTLREMGIGDMGIPKHMRKMMKAFNGRMHAYAQALESDDLQEALRNNLYGTVDELDEKKLAKMAQKAQDMLVFLKTQDVDAILGGTVEFEKE